MAPRNTRQEAYRAGFENPLMGDIGPLQRLYGTVSAIGSELGGADMGTPFGQRFGESQKATKAEIKRLQDLRAKHPEEFGRGMMQAQEQMDPYMLGLGTGSIGGMRPMGATRFEPAYGASPVQQIAGRGPMEGLPAPAPRMLGAPQAAPATPYYRSVPSEMGTSPGPMNAFNQNMYGMSTGRYGPMGANYVPEMAVTDFESYAPGGMGRTSPETWGRPMSKFDENMLGAYRQGRYNRMAGGRPSMAGEYTPEEMGSAMVPYRQGGLVYKPVGAQGAGPRQISGPQGSPRLGYERGPIEGEFSEVRGIGGPQGRQPYGGSMDFGVTREGQAVSPTGMRFDPRMAAATISGGAGYMAGREGAGRGPLPPFRPNIPVSGERMGMSGMYPVMPMGSTGLSGQAPGAGTVFEQPSAPAAQPEGRKAAGKKAGGKSAPMPPKRPGDLGVEAPFDPNLNYLVTQALDQLLGGGEAERGRQFQQYYAAQPWPY